MDKARGECFAAAAPDEIIRLRTQSSRLAVFGGRGMSFNICRGTLGSLAMFTMIKNASSPVSSFALDRRPDSFS
jgi:hypothetical protein